MGTAAKHVNLQQDKNTHARRETQKLKVNRNAVSSGELCLCVSINRKCCTESRASKRAKHRLSDSGHHSIVTVTNELLTRGSGEQIPPSLCVMFALNTLISELRNRQTSNWREGCVELSQVFVYIPRTSLGWLNITMCLLKSLNLAN